MKKILIVGYGSIAKRHIKNIKQLYPGASLYVVSSRGASINEKIENILFFETISAALKYSPDFAIVASPSTFHALHAQQLLEANTPVLVEKPLTSTTMDAQLLLKAAKKSAIPISVAYCLRHLSSAKIIKTLIEENKIGTIYNIHAHVGQYLPDWRQDKNYKDSVSASSYLGGGALLELSHELDYLQWLMGKLHFNYGILRHTKELSLDVEEIADVILTTTLGAVCTVHMNFVQKQAQRYCSFIGEKGIIYWNLIANSVSLYINNKSSTIFNEPNWDKNNMYLIMIEEFVQKIGGGGSKDNILTEAYQTVELIEQIKLNAVWGVKL